MKTKKLLLETKLREMIHHQILEINGKNKEHEFTTADGEHMLIIKYPNGTVEIRHGTGNAYIFLSKSDVVTLKKLL